MDDEGTWNRCTGDIPVAEWRGVASPEIQQEYFKARGFKQGLSDDEKVEICSQIWESLTPESKKQLDAKRRRPVPDRATFNALPYANRIEHCIRPENVNGPSAEAWVDINSHLGTSATCLTELTEQLARGHWKPCEVPKG